MSTISWKTILLPPLSALFLYLLTTHALLPLYTRYLRTRGSRYTPLSPFSPHSHSHSTNPNNPNNNNNPPSPSSTAAAAHLFDEFRTRVSDLLGRARSESLNGEVGRFLGDEELEEGVVYGGGAGGEGEESGRRLGRELEGGFMDDWSSEEEGERRRVRGVLGGVGGGGG